MEAELLFWQGVTSTTFLQNVYLALSLYRVSHTNETFKAMVRQKPRFLTHFLIIDLLVEINLGDRVVNVPWTSSGQWRNNGKSEKMVVMGKNFTIL